jgi:hypothetical protein
MKYADKLKDPRWQKKRLEILDNRGWACELCCDKSQTLHVHHTTYLPNKEPWEYDNLHLRVLCEDCHDSEHNGEDLELTIDLCTSYFGFTKEEVNEFLWFGINKLFVENIHED